MSLLNHTWAYVNEMTYGEPHESSSMETDHARGTTMCLGGWVWSMWYQPNFLISKEMLYLKNELNNVAKLQ